MMNVCHNCGEYRVDKEIDPTGPYAICPLCGFKHEFRQLPLLMVGGACGVGKSTIYHHLLGTLDYAVPLDSDILWRPEFNRPEDNHRQFFEVWLRLSKNISQSGRPVVLFGSGLTVPENVEPCVERRYFSAVHYLALTCDDEVIVERLQARPAWRKCGDPEFINAHVKFNQWFKQKATALEPPVELLDTTGLTIEETGMHVSRWIGEKIDASPSIVAR